MEDELERRGDRPDESSTQKLPEEFHRCSKAGGSEAAGGGGGDESAEACSRDRAAGAQELTLSPRGRGYLARLVVDVCNELDQNKRVSRGELCFLKGPSRRFILAVRTIDHPAPEYNLPKIIVTLCIFSCDQNVFFRK